MSKARDTRYNLILGNILMISTLNNLFAMETKEAQEEKESWRCIQELSVENYLNALYAYNNKKQVQTFRLLHEDGGPQCSNYRRMSIVGALQHQKSQKLSQNSEHILPTAFAQHTYGWAEGYNNGIVKIVDTHKAVADRKTVALEIYAYPEKEVIALQFSPDGWYLATLACSNLKVWERQQSTGSNLEKRRSNTPKLSFDRPQKTKIQCCPIM